MGKDQMNTHRVRAATETIDRQTRALKWLETYGTKLTGKNDGDISIKIALGFAGSCEGANEATSVMEAYSRLAIPEVVMTAIQSCRNDIEIARNTIRQEMEESE